MTWAQHKYGGRSLGYLIFLYIDLNLFPPKKKGKSNAERYVRQTYKTKIFQPTNWLVKKL